MKKVALILMNIAACLVVLVGTGICVTNSNIQSSPSSPESLPFNEPANITFDNSATLFGDWGWKLATDISDAHNFINGLGAYDKPVKDARITAVWTGTKAWFYIFYQSGPDPLFGGWGWKLATDINDAHNFINGLGAYDKPVKDARITAVWTGTKAWFYIFYQSGDDTEIDIPYTFSKQGWYLISLPVTPSDNKLSTLFPTALSAFGYNANTGSYYSTTTLETKTGYWLLIPSATSVTISGVPLTSFTEHYPAGWHLIGSVNATTNFTDPDDNPNGSIIGAYGWDVNAGQYFPVYPPGAGVLKAKQGYWLAAFQDCDLTIGSGASASAGASTDNFMESFRKQFGSEPPQPPFALDRSVAQLLPITEITLRNYPNPFNPETVIEYSLPNAGFTRIVIYNALGQKIRTMLDEEKSSGTYRVLWDGRNETGELVPNGIYFCRISSMGVVKTRKMLLLK